MDSEIKQWLEKGKIFDFNGHKIFYLQEGAGDNLLLIHGYPYSSFEWKAIWGELTKKYSVIAFDLLGMGFSDKPKNHIYSFHEHAEIVNRLLQNLNITETHILSHDLGVSVVQELIALDKESKNNFKIDSSAFLNGGLFMDRYQPRLIQKLLSQSPDFFGKLLSKIIPKRAVNKSVRELFGTETQPTEEYLDKQWEILNYNNGKEIAYLIGRLVFEKNNHQTRWIEAMQTTEIPMCFINGPADPNSGIEMANRYKELIPNPKVYFLGKKIGHWGHLEDANSVIEAYFNFRYQTV